MGKTKRCIVIFLAFIPLSSCSTSLSNTFLLSVFRQKPWWSQSPSPSTFPLRRRRSCTSGKKRTVSRNVSNSPRTDPSKSNCFWFIIIDLSIKNILRVLKVNYFNLLIKLVCKCNGCYKMLFIFVEEMCSDMF